MSNISDPTAVEAAVTDGWTLDNRAIGKILAYSMVFYYPTEAVASQMALQCTSQMVVHLVSLLVGLHCRRTDAVHLAVNVRTVVCLVEHFETVLRIASGKRIATLFAFVGKTQTEPAAAGHNAEWWMTTVGHETAHVLVDFVVGNVTIPRPTCVPLVKFGVGNANHYLLATVKLDLDTTGRTPVLASPKGKHGVVVVVGIGERPGRIWCVK